MIALRRLGRHWAAIACLLAGLAGLARANGPTLAGLAEAREWGSLAAALPANGTVVNAAQADGMTALLWAVWHDQAEAVESLLAAGAEANVVNRYGVTPLALAAGNGNAGITRSLLAHGADANATTRDGETVLLTAARTGRVEVVKALLAHGADVSARERDDHTALMWAAHEGHVETVRALLEAGADPTVRTRTGFTAWLFAVRQGHTEVVRALLAAGQDVNEAAPAREGPPGRGLRSGTSALILATINGHLELALELVAAGADPNDARSGDAALHLLPSVRKPHTGEDEDGMPPPAGSGRVTSLEFLRAMVAAGADVNLPVVSDRKPRRGDLHMGGVTPFFQAARRDDLPLMRALLELGADPLRGNVDGCTPLLAAAGVGVLTPDEDAGTAAEAIEAIDLLLELGADINHVDDNGETVMHGAAYKNVPEVVHHLVARGADIAVWNRPDRYGWTPMNLAEGYRPGNFKPSASTGAALTAVIQQAGVALDQGPKPVLGDNY